MGSGWLSGTAWLPSGMVMGRDAGGVDVAGRVACAKAASVSALDVPTMTIVSHPIAGTRGMNPLRGSTAFLRIIVAASLTGIGLKDRHRASLARIAAVTGDGRTRRRPEDLADRPAFRKRGNRKIPKSLIFSRWKSEEIR